MTIFFGNRCFQKRVWIIPEFHPPEGKPMSSVKRGHKIRTREKRQFKRELAEDVCLLLRHGLSKDSEAAREEEPIEHVEAVEL